MENIKKYILENHKNHCTVKVSSNSAEDEILNKIAEKVMCGGILLKLENSDMADGDFLEICKKVKPISVTGDGTIVVGWSGLIFDNMEKFRDFTEKYWENQYDDDDDFVFEWINEIHMYMAGYVSEDFYRVLVDFVNTLD